MKSTIGYTVSAGSNGFRNTTMDEKEAATLAKKLVKEGCSHVYVSYINTVNGKMGYYNPDGSYQMEAQRWE